MNKKSMPHANEASYQKMVEEVQDYAILLLDNNGIISNWNKGAQQIKQYTEAEAVGMHFQMFYLPEDRNTGLPERLLNEARVNGRAIHEGWRLRKDRTKFWGSITLTALHNEQGEVIGFSKVTRDLTERKQTEDKMREYLLQLETKNKELEQMTHVVSHDMQEPLRKIQMFSDIVSNLFPDNATAQKYFQKINVSAGRMRALIYSMLNYTSLLKDENKMEDTDLDKILKDILADFDPLIKEKNAKIESEPLPVIRAIPLQVGQLFYNLIDNALKFNNNKHPEIRISCAVAEYKVPGYLSEGNYLQITFADNGTGFDDKYESLMFSMFQQLHGKHEYSGTGIGLTLCKKIMENHHGFIRAAGEPDKGATFYLYFPVNPYIQV